MEPFNKEEQYLRAKGRVEEIKKFYSNLVSYVVVISFLAFLNYTSNHFAHPWFLWAAGGWGIGLLFHAAKAFQWNPFFSKDWERRKIEQFMEEDKEAFHRTHWE